MGFFNNIIPKGTVEVSADGQMLTQYDGRRWVRKRHVDSSNPIIDNNGDEWYWYDEVWIDSIITGENINPHWKKFNRDISEMLPHTVKVTSKIISYDLVPVQPICGPVGQLMYMDFPSANKK